MDKTTRTIGRWFDFFSIWGAITFSLLLTLLHSPTEPKKSLVHLLIVVVPLELGHVFATIFPVIRKYKCELRLFKRNLIIAALFFTLMSIALWKISPGIFYVILAFYNLFHILSQQFGFMRISEREIFKTPIELIVERIHMWNLMLFPVAYWLSDYSDMNKMYFRDGDLLAIVPDEFMPILFVLHMVLLVLYLVYSLGFTRRTVFNPFKFSVVYGTWFLLYSSIILLSDLNYLLVGLICVHSLLYMTYCFRVSAPSPLLEMRYGVIIYILFLTSMGLIWKLSFVVVNKFDVLSTSAVAVLWVPLFLHYYYDSYIWSKKI